MMPIHNSTFDLSLHDWHEPLEKAFQLSKERNVTLASPIIGERLTIANPAPATKWWYQE